MRRHACMVAQDSKPGGWASIAKILTTKVMVLRSLSKRSAEVIQDADDKDLSDSTRGCWGLVVDEQP